MLVSRYIHPFTDFGFKKLFGEEANKDLLIDFLNELLKGKAFIKRLTFLKNEHLALNASDRKAIFDLYCENEYGEKFIVEIQNVKQQFFKDRSIYYSTFAIQEQAVRGEWNYELKAVYTIGIMDFIFDDDKEGQDQLLHEVQLWEKHKRKIFYDKLIFIYLEMPKFRKSVEELETHFDKWLFVLKNLAKLENRPPALQERIFERLFEAAEVAKFNRQEFMSYEDSLKAYRDIKNAIDTAVEEAREEERKIKEQQLEAMSRKMQEEKILMAQKMKQDGFTAELIFKYTGLSAEQIENL